MRLKTIREQLLFAAHYHFQLSKAKQNEYVEMAGRNKSLAREAKRGFITHTKMALAMDEALKLL